MAARRSTKSPMAGALAVASVLALLLAGCGGSDPDAAEVVRASPDKTIESGSSRVAVDVSFTSGGTTATVRGDGLFDLRNRKGALNLDLAELEEDLGSGLGSGKVETVLDGNAIYVKLPSGVLPGSRPWFKLDLATLGEQVGVDVGALGQLQQSDPTQILAFLRGAGSDVREAGEEKVRGADTTHYRAIVDLRRAGASLPPEGKEAMEGAIDALGTATLPTDVWIDDEGRLRKMHMSIDPDGTGPIQSGTIGLELFDFGVDVDVNVPAADQVTDLTQLLGGLAPRPPP